tara:strand:- start:403 stop:1242 length:840 start_codon:yes stop_codon:yes gene_type:complete
MAFAQGSRSSLSYIVESTFGTTPAGNFQNLPFTSHSLNMTKDRVEGTDIQADLRDTDFDDLIEGAMMSTWATNVIKIGTTPKYFSIEDYAADIDQSRLFTGCSVNTLSVSLAPNAMVAGTFGLVGKNMVISATEKTQDAATDASPFDAYSGDLEIGGTTSAIVTAMDFTLTNGVAPTFVVGDDSAPSLEVGNAVIEGSMSVYFEDEAMINRFINETETSLKVTVGDNAGTPNTLEFFFPRCKINSADVGVDGPTSRMIAMSFVALRDDTEATSLRITRS